MDQREVPLLVTPFIAFLVEVLQLFLEGLLLLDSMEGHLTLESFVSPNMNVILVGYLHL